MTKKSPPLVGIPACVIELNESLFHRVAEKYITGVVEETGCLPLLIPALGDHLDFDDLVDRLDGLLLTGSPSNVEPHQYDGQPSHEGTKHDPQRDEVTLPLIRAAIERGVPLFAICRGTQELNVALGGTLHQNVHELEGKNDHRMNRELPREERYDDRHPIKISPGGILHRLTDGADEVMVNSLHAQAIDRPAAGVFVEAVSDDGVIEAISVLNAPAFTLGVQWHPEPAIVRELPLSKAIYRAFGKAVRDRQISRSSDRSPRAA
tara:strand:- start:191 stop:982 length:792 start_codon:yes stop_codon:yes gene_type:complete